MKSIMKIASFLAVVVLLNSPHARADGVTGGVAVWHSTLSAPGNFVSLPIDPTRWASATLSFSSGAFSGTLIWDMTINGQWVAAPYAVLTSTASANPSTAASVAYAGVAADTWDLPLPGNITAVRVRSSAVTSGSVVATLTPGRPHIPGVPVVATLVDVTSAVGGALDTGAIDLAGWSLITLAQTAPATGTGYGYPVDNAGNYSSGAFDASTSSAAGASKTQMIGAGSGNSAAASFKPPRMRWIMTAVAAATSRIWITATR